MTRSEALRGATAGALLAAAWLAGCGGGGGRLGYDAGASDAALGDGPDAVTPLRVATWNVHDLFDSIDDPEMDMVLSPSEATAKLAAVGRVVRAIDADVVVLEEVEKIEVLDALATGPLAGMGYEQRGLFEGNDPRGIDVAYLSRVPIDFARTHAGDRFASADGTMTYAFSRDVLEIAPHPPSGRVLVLGAHLRSQLGGADGDAHRLAEALQIRRIVDDRIAAGAARIMVVGDLNDVPGSPSLDALVGDGVLVDLTDRVPLADRWTYVYSGEQRVYDHALANMTVADATTGVTILHGPEVDSTSDHQPVIVDLLLAP